MKKQKGITLVALVITIAIMLILVGVTINISLKGGLFSRANEATAQMQIEAEKEDLLTAALGTLGRNGKVNIAELDNNLPEGFTGSNGIYTSSTGNRYQVTEDADIIVLDGTEEEPEEDTTPKYELSGIWEFNDTFVHTTEFTEIVEISFTSNSTNFNSISITITGYMGASFKELFIKYGETDFAVYTQYMVGEPFPVADYFYEEGYKTLDFGSTPQPVSQQFYEWFTANATKVT